MKQKILASLLLLGVSSALGCAQKNEREPVLVPASGTAGARASVQPTEQAPSTRWPSPNLANELDLSQSGEQPTKLAQPLPGAVPGRAARETASGMTGTGQIPYRVPAAREVELLVDQAATRITASRCERALVCENVGSRRQYDTLVDCQRRLSGDTRRVLGPSCNNGVDVSRLDDCEREIRASNCNLALDMDRATSCHPNTLCNR